MSKVLIARVPLSDEVFSQFRSAFVSGGVTEDDVVALPVRKIGRDVLVEHILKFVDEEGGLRPTPFQYKDIGVHDAYQTVLLLTSQDPLFAWNGPAGCSAELILWLTHEGEVRVLKDRCGFWARRNGKGQEVAV